MTGQINDGELSVELDALESSLRQQRRQVLATALVGPAVVGTVAAGVLVWRSEISDVGLWAPLGLWGGHVATLTLGTLAVLLGVVATRFEPRALWAVAVCSLLGAVTCVADLGYRDGPDKHVGPAPWLAFAGLLTCAAVAVLWASDQQRSRPAADPTSSPDAAARVRQALERRPD